MKKITLLLLSLLGTYSFGQYYSEAKIKLKKADEPFEVLDLRYQDKLIKFRLKEMPNVLVSTKVKHIEDIKFDPNNYSDTVPEIMETYLVEKLNYPNGVYETLESFVNKQPIEKQIYFKSNIRSDFYFEYKNDLVNFYELDKTSLKNSFAIVHDDIVYLNVKGIMNNRGEGNGNLSKDIPNNTFLRVKAGTDDYLYVEMPMTKTSSAILSGIAGGLTAGVLSAGANAITAGITSGVANGVLGMSSPSYLKGIVLDTKNKEYDIFKNCKDFNLFLETRNKDLIVNCEKDYHLSNVRGTINNL